MSALFFAVAASHDNDDDHCRLAIVGSQVVTEPRKKAVEELGADIGYFGALPQINTRILAGSDSDSHGFVFVEYSDFEAEFN